eukprot:CAMPEP_0182546828 /NCGR_PEP_ID=MMETSP1323-20130603/36609_1 /TAXON_ID=236787 /ORGANISM="Florenciella parvula, Strain RCC1693" /LENGTH=61 /DNA_ID=CAMNT_0024758091 /DNA_START=56 /DNA_END=241 /DNA_ORIENTATION=+
MLREQDETSKSKDVGWGHERTDGHWTPVTAAHAPAFGVVRREVPPHSLAAEVELRCCGLYA